MILGNVARWTGLVAAGTLAAAGCSSTSRHDQYYGTDAGLVYQAPEGGYRFDAQQKGASDTLVASDTLIATDAVVNATDQAVVTSNDVDASVDATDIHADADSGGPDER